MLKMILDPMGGIVLTNDGNAILREIDVVHPAAKSIIELSRAQDENVGDGTTSVVILGILIQYHSSLLTITNVSPTLNTKQVTTLMNKQYLALHAHFSRKNTLPHALYHMPYYPHTLTTTHNTTNRHHTSHHQHLHQRVTPIAIRYDARSW